MGLVRPDRVVLVSDGAEDEYIYPVVSSRVKVDSVRKVFVKQVPTVEGTYYILIKMLNDEKVRKRIVVPIGLALLVFGIFALLDPIIMLFQGSAEVSFTNMGLAMIWAVVGLYLVMFAYKAGDRAREWWKETQTAVKEGSTMLPFAVRHDIPVRSALRTGRGSVGPRGRGAGEDRAVRGRLHVDVRVRLLHLPGRPVHQ